FVLATRSGSSLALYGAGVSAGLGFYTFYSARTILPVVGLFVLSERRWWRRLPRLWPLALGFAVTVAPIALVSKGELITRMVSQVPGGYSSGISGPVGQRIVNNLSRNLLAFNFNPSIDHYVSGSLLDPATAVLAALGVALAVWRIRDHSFRLLLIWLLVALGVTGLLSPYPGVAVTRLHYCLPPLALMAALAAVQIWRELPALPERLPGRWLGGCTLAM